MNQAQLENELGTLRTRFEELEAAVAKRFLGQEEVLELMLLGLLADGHVLLEGAPGLGKTTLVRGLSDCLGVTFRRIQFTPDLLPPDVIGTRMLEEDAAGHREFCFLKGPIFTNVLLADEINRATPRTQSALLEAMQERQVTVFGETHRLDDPFCVIATQNPIEMEGTYPLPEAQLDRFVLKIELAQPTVEQLERILGATTNEKPEFERDLFSREDLVRIRGLVRQIPASEDMVSLAARIVHHTHPGAEHGSSEVSRYVRHGSSPRGGQAMLLLAKARALVAGRLCVTEDDILFAAAPTLRHRLILGYEGEASGVHPDQLVAEACTRARKSG